MAMAQTDTHAITVSKLLLADLGQYLRTIDKRSLNVERDAIEALLREVDHATIKSYYRNLEEFQAAFIMHIEACYEKAGKPWERKALVEALFTLMKNDKLSAHIAKTHLATLIDSIRSWSQLKPILQARIKILESWRAPEIAHAAPAPASAAAVAAVVSPKAGALGDLNAPLLVAGRQQTSYAGTPSSSAGAGARSPTADADARLEEAITQGRTLRRELDQARQASLAAHATHTDRSCCASITRGLRRLTARLTGGAPSP